MPYLLLDKVIGDDSIAKPAEEGEGQEESKVGIGSTEFFEPGHQRGQQTHHYYYELSELLLNTRL